MRYSVSDAIERTLIALGIPYEKEFRFHPTRKWRADFALPHKILVEAEGAIFVPNSGHRSARGVIRDVEKHNEAAALGYWVVRVTERDTKGENRWIEIVMQIAERERCSATAT